VKYKIHEHYMINLSSTGPKHKGRFYVQGFGDKPIMVHFKGTVFPDFFNRTPIKPLLEKSIKDGKLDLCSEVEGELKKDTLKVDEIIRVCT